MMYVTIPVKIEIEIANQLITVASSQKLDRWLALK